MKYRITAKGILREDDKILFIEYEFNNKLFYSLPGGEQKIGESLKECVKREFAEETRIDITAGQLIMVNEFIEKSSRIVPQWQDGIHQIENIFIVRKTDNPILISEETKDIGMRGTKWLSKKELEQVHYFPKMKIDWFFKQTYPDLTYKVDKTN